MFLCEMYNILSEEFKSTLDLKNPLRVGQWRIRVRTGEGLFECVFAFLCLLLGVCAWQRKREKEGEMKGVYVFACLFMLVFVCERQKQRAGLVCLSVYVAAA